MPYIFAGLMAVSLSWMFALFMPANNALDKAQAFKVKVAEDMQSMDAAFRLWFRYRANARTRTWIDPNTTDILPATAQSLSKMFEGAAPFGTPRNDPLGNPYYIKYLNGNNFVKVGATDIIPLTKDNSGRYNQAPIVVIGSPGFNGVWDVATVVTVNAGGGTVSISSNDLSIIAGLTSPNYGWSKGDDIFWVVRFDRELNQIVEHSRAVLRNVAAGMSVFFNVKNATQQGYYPLTLDDFVTWTGYKDGQAGLPSQVSAFSLDGFGYPLQYAPTGLFLDSPANTQPLQVAVDVQWFSQYGLQ